MTETFSNRYVVRVKSGHPGYVDHRVISTADGLRELVRRLENALRGAPGPGRDEDGRMLVSIYASEAYGQSERVYLSFHVATDLAPYHRESFRFGHRMAIFWVPALVVLGLAFVGLRVAVDRLVSWYVR